jgi:hypothetical protein
MEQIKLQWVGLTDSQKRSYMPNTQISPKTSLHAQNSCGSQAGIQQTPELSGIKNTPTEDEVLGECKLGEKECSDVQTTRDEGMSPLKQGIHHFYSMCLEQIAYNNFLPCSTFSKR